MALEKVGIVKISRSEKSFHVIFNSPNSVLGPDHLFISRKSLRALDSGELAECNLFLLEIEPENISCEKPELRG